MLIFNEAQALSLTHRLDYIGESFNYRNVQNYSIRGKMISNSATDEVSAIGFSYYGESGMWIPFPSGSPYTTGTYDTFIGHYSIDGGLAYVDLQGANSIFQDAPPLYDIWEGMDSVKSQFSDFQEIILNGVSIGSGRVTSIRFPESRDARQSNYQVDFEVYKTGDLSNWSGAGYQTPIQSQLCKYVEGLDETFSFNYNKDGSIVYNRNLAFGLINSNISDSGYIPSVKQFASGLFYGNPAFAAALSQFPSYYTSSGNRVFSESYNIFEGRFSFSEEFIGGIENQPYYWDKSYSLSVGNNGVNTVSENGSVIGTALPKYDSAKSGINDVFSTSLGRLTEFYNNYAGLFCDDTLKLKNTLKKIDAPAGRIEYALTYDNDPFGGIGYYITRSIDIEKGQGGEFRASERGTITSNIGENPEEKVLNSANYFKNNIESGIGGRVYDSYFDFPDFCGCSGVKTTGDIALFGKNMTFEESSATVSYDYQYKSLCGYEIYNDFLISFDREIKNTTHNVAVEITPYSGEIAQRQNTSSLIVETQTIEAIGNLGSLSIEDYIGACSQRISPPASNTFFMSDCSYNFTPDQSRMEMNVTFQYTGYRDYTNADV